MNTYKPLLFNPLFSKQDIKEFINYFDLREEDKDCHITISPNQSKRFTNILIEAVIRPEEYLKNIKEQLIKLKNKVLNSSYKFSLTDLCNFFNSQFKNYKIIFKELSKTGSRYVDSRGIISSTLDIILYCFYNVINIQKILAYAWQWQIFKITDNILKNLYKYIYEYLEN